jgi:tryptophan synthase alpha chain
MIEKNSKSLIPFIMVGYPSYATSLRFANILAEEGVKVLEIGIPFSDPLADGPVIQRASQVALENGIGLKEVFSFVSELKTSHPALKIVLFTYLNPLLSYGLKSYAEDAVKAGANATLTVDLPPEEAFEYVQIHRQSGLKTVFLASPTTTPDRLRIIDEMSTAFVYYVSRAGVTGEAYEVSATLKQEMSVLRENVKQSIAIGFGISTPEQALQVAKLADAVVIGSRLLRLMDDGETVFRSFVKTTLQRIAIS